MIEDCIRRNDHLYLKVLGSEGVISLPLCEVINGELVVEKSNPPEKYVFRTRNKADGSMVEHPVTANELASSCLSVLLEMTVEEFAIQPAGVPMTNEVVDFLQRHRRK